MGAFLSRCYGVHATTLCAPPVPFVMARARMASDAATRRASGKFCRGPTGAWHTPSQRRAVPRRGAFVKSDVEIIVGREAPAVLPEGLFSSTSKPGLVSALFDQSLVAAVTWHCWLHVCVCVCGRAVVHMPLRWRLAQLHHMLMLGCVMLWICGHLYEEHWAASSLAALTCSLVCTPVRNRSSAPNSKSTSHPCDLMESPQCLFKQ